MGDWNCVSDVRCIARYFVVPVLVDCDGGAWRAMPNNILYATLSSFACVFSCSCTQIRIACHLPLPPLLSTPSLYPSNAMNCTCLKSAICYDGYLAYARYLSDVLPAVQDVPFPCSDLRFLA
jgi:hypothetical protein